MGEEASSGSFPEEFVDVDFCFFVFDEEEEGFFSFEVVAGRFGETKEFVFCFFDLEKDDSGGWSVGWVHGLVLDEGMMTPHDTRYFRASSLVMSMFFMSLGSTRKRKPEMG